MNENNKLPAGWGDTEDEEDYGFPETGENSPWGEASLADESEAEGELPWTDETGENAPEDQIIQRNIPHKKKSTLVLIAVIAAVAAAGGVIGGVTLVRKLMDAKQSVSITASEPPESTDISTEIPAETESVQTQARTETIQAEVPAESESTSEVLSYAVYEEASIRAMDEFLQMTYYGFDYPLDSVMYSLIDVNEDSVPELFLKYPTAGATGSSLYIYNGSDYAECDAVIGSGEGARVCTAEHLIESYGYGGAVVRYIYEMDAAGNVTLKDEIYHEDGTYMCSGEPISSAEYDEINRYYDSLRWEDIDRYEYRNSEMPKSPDTEPTDVAETLSFLPPQALYEPTAMDSGLIHSYPAYIDFIQNACSAYDSAELANISYALYDLNADEVPELIITRNGYMTGIYTISASSVFTLCEDAERYWYRLTSSGLIVGEGSTEASNYYYSFERFDGGDKTTHLARLTVSYSEGGTAVNYYDDGYNSIEITDAQKRELLDFSVIEFESTPITDVITAEPPAQSVPTIDAWIETREVYVDFDGDGIEEPADGCELYLCVSGDYDSYYYEFYTADPDGSNPCLCNSGTISSSELFLTSGSGGFAVIVEIIPIAADGTQGEAVYATLVL